MSNGHTPRSFKEIREALFQTGLDQAPQEAPQEASFGPPTFADIRRRMLSDQMEFVPTTEPGLVGFGKGALEGITRPFRLFGVDPDLSPARVVEGERFPALPSTGSRVFGDLAGMGVPITLFTGGASSLLTVSGLAAAMGPNLTRIGAGALGFGAFEAGTSEDVSEVPHRFMGGAAVGAAFELMMLRLFGRMKGRSESELFEYTIEEPTYLPGTQRQLPSGEPGRIGRTTTPEPKLLGRTIVTPRYEPPSAPKGAGGGGPAVAPSGGRVIETTGEVVHTQRLSRGLYQDLMSRAGAILEDAAVRGEDYVGPALLAWAKALEGAKVTSRGAVVDLSDAALEGAISDLENLAGPGGIYRDLASETDGQIYRGLIRPAGNTLKVLQEIRARRGTFADVQAGRPEVAAQTVISNTLAEKEVQLRATRHPLLREIPELRRVPPVGYGIYPHTVRNLEGDATTLALLTPPKYPGETFPIYGRGTVEPSGELRRLGVRGDVDILQMPDGTFGYMERGVVGRGPEFIDPRTVVDDAIVPLDTFISLGGQDIEVVAGYRGSPVGYTGDGVVLRLSQKFASDLFHYPGFLPRTKERVKKLALFADSPVNLFFDHETASIMQSELSRYIVDTRAHGRFSSDKEIERYISSMQAVAQLEAYAPNLLDIVADLQTVRIDPTRQLPVPGKGIAQYREASRKRGRKIFEPDQSTSLSGTRYLKVDPDALALERQFYGHGSVLTLIERLGFALNPDDQLAVAAARMGASFRYGGSTILTRISNPGRVIKAIRAVDPSLQVVAHASPDGYTELLVSSPYLVGPKALIDRTTTLETKNIVERLVSEDVDHKVRLDEAVKILRAPIVGEQLPQVSVLTGFTPDDLRGLFDTALGDYSEFFKRIRLATEGDVDPRGTVSTLVHEYTHHLIVGALDRIESSTATPRSGALEAIFGPMLSPDDYVIAFHKSVPSRVRRQHGGLTQPKMSEIVELTIAEESKDYASGTIPPRESDRWQVAANRVLGDQNYYLNDTELAARTVEMMLFDIKTARKIAPRVVSVMSRLISELSPKMQMIFRGQALEAVNAILHDKVIVGQVELTHTIDHFSGSFGILTPELKHQFTKWGVHKWMPGIVGGRTVIAKGEFAAGEGTEATMSVIDPLTGNSHRVNINKFRRGDATSFADSRKATREVAEHVMSGEVEEIPFFVEHPEAQRVYLQRAIFREAEFNYVNDDAFFVNGYDELAQWAASRNPELGDAFVPHGAYDILIPRLLEKISPKAMLLFNDSGARKLYLATPLRAAVPEGAGLAGRITDTFPAAMVDKIDARVGDRVVHLNPRTIAEYLLRSHYRVNERDLAYLVDEVVDAVKAKQFLGAENAALATDIERTMVANEKRLFGPGPDTYSHKTRLDRSANRVDARVDRTVDGRYRVEVDASSAPREAGVFIEPEEVEDFLRRAGQKWEDFAGRSRRTDNTGSYEKLGDAENIGRSGMGGEPPPPGGGGYGGKRGGRYNSGGSGGMGGGGGSRGPRFGETLDGDIPPDGPGWVGRIRDAVLFFGSFATALENTAKIIERRLGLPAYTKIFQPLQEAIRTVDREMMLKRPGRSWSFHDKLKTIEKLSWRLNRQQREQVIAWLEAMSREDIIRPGGLTARGANPEEILAADAIRHLGQHHNMPKLISTWRMMRNLTNGRKQFMRQYRQMFRQQQTSGIDIDPVVRARLDELYKLARLPNAEWSISKLGQRLNLNPAEQKIIELLEATSKMSKDDFSVFLVSRLAAADPLPRGFKSMRDVIANRYGMSETQLRLGREMQELFEESFKASGIDPKRYLGGYYPHLRQYAQHGIMPDAPWVRDLMPKASTFTANKFRTGELDPYSLEPLKVAYKHVRGMLMHQHFDPLLKNVRGVLTDMKSRNPRAWRIMNEYVYELQGRPHVSFQNLQSIVQETAQILGVSVDRDFSSQIINGLAALTYQATIPFRAALIARNYFQMLQMIVPRVGARDFFEGLRIALTKEGFAMARRANAVTENVAPIISQEALFDFTGLKLSRRMQRLTEVGFRWYQKADDLGRATAFHAQRVRASRALSQWQKGAYGNPRSQKSFLKMLNEGKVSTFDPLDQQQFVDLLKAGRIEEAKSYLGEMLARETIFRYGHANHPAGWGSVAGRLFGQFGTWPVQYKDFLVQGLTRGTVKDKAEFLLWHGGINAGVVTAGAKFGYDLNSWVSFPSIQYTGGPWAEVAIDLMKLVGGSDMEQALALKSLQFQFVPTLSDPRTIMFPTSYAVNDLSKLFQQGGRFDEALGFRLLEPEINSSNLLLP